MLVRVRDRREREERGEKREKEEGEEKEREEREKGEVRKRREGGRELNMMVVWVRRNTSTSLGRI